MVIIYQYYSQLFKDSNVKNGKSDLFQWKTMCQTIKLSFSQWMYNIHLISTWSQDSLGESARVTWY